MGAAGLGCPLGNVLEHLFESQRGTRDLRYFQQRRGGLPPVRFRLEQPGVFDDDGDLVGERGDQARVARVKEMRLLAIHG